MAEATDIATFRRRVGDPVKSDSDNSTGNNSDRVFNLRFDNIFDLVVRKDNTELDLTTDYTVNAQAGTVTFVTAPTDNADLQFDYSYAAFTDDEAGSLIDTYGLAKAIIEALKELLADAARLYNYSKGGSSSERSQIFDHLKDLLALYEKEGEGFVIGEDGSTSNVMIGKRRWPRHHHRRIITDLSRQDL